jgi:fused signal recognition particle receptor
MKIFDFFKKSEQSDLDKGLEKTRDNLFGKLKRAIASKSKVDDELLDSIEEILIEADVSVTTTMRIVESLQESVASNKYFGIEELKSQIKSVIGTYLLDTSDIPQVAAKPFVLLVVGVNGVGKTTTIGKLASRISKSGKKVILGAADTFRAAAVDQLKIWGERCDVEVVDHGMGSDPASVAFDTLEKAVKENADYVIIDTAGRLHNKTNLMNELGKIKRVMSKVLPDAPHETMLVLDGSTGQNALEQTKQFTQVTDVNSLAITKMDGTAKGGVIIGICDQYKVPVRYIGLGEQIDQLKVFDKQQYLDSLFSDL